MSIVVSTLPKRRGLGVIGFRDNVEQERTVLVLKVLALVRHGFFQIITSHSIGKFNLDLSYEILSYSGVAS